MAIRVREGTSLQVSVSDSTEARKFLSPALEPEQGASITNASVVSATTEGMTALSSQAVDIAESVRRELSSGVADPLLRSREDVRRAAGIVSARPSAPNVRRTIDPASISRIELSFDADKGSVDCFCARITIDVPITALGSGLVGVRIMRRGPDPISGGASLSHRGLEMIQAAEGRSRSKNQNYLSSFEANASGSGVANAVSMLNGVDPVRGLRTSADSAPPTTFVQDRSVEEDLKTSARIRQAMSASSLTNDQFSQQTYLDGASRLGDEHVRQIRSSFSGSLVTESSANSFKEIAFVPRDRMGSKKNAAGVVEFTFDDTSIRYMQEYAYYVVSVGQGMAEGVRSRSTLLSTRVARVPARPKSLVARHLDSGIVINVSVDDAFVEKFEIYRRIVGEPPARGSTEITTISAQDGFVSSKKTRTSLPSGFEQIVEVTNDRAAGAVFFDRSLVGGKSYEYRVYSVDIFGNKSESPATAMAFVPEPSTKANSLDSPIVVAEPDAAIGKMRLKMSCADARVTSFLLSRRDMSLHQHAFTSPGSDAVIKLGNPSPGKSARSFDDAKMYGTDGAFSWNGRFENRGDVVEFIDNSSMFDHIYQYRLIGMDVFGNETNSAFTTPQLVSRRARLEAPASFSGTLAFDIDGSISGTLLTWIESNVEFSAADLVGSRKDLANTSVRTIYQIDRKRKGEEIWESFPMVEGLSFFDPLLSGSAPPFRPEYPQRNSTYSYRISSFQTGSFVSSYSEPVEIVISEGLVVPSNFRLRSSDSKVRPFYVVINWDTPEQSADVDSWDIERAEVNNFAAARMNLTNPRDFMSLQFVPYRTVAFESSRSKARTTDEDRQRDNLFSGMHSFMDMKVQLGNTYFYRIRSRGALVASFSQWVYKGIRLTDDAFEKKLSSVLSDLERAQLAATLVPLRVKDDYFMGDQEKELSSFSLTPSVFNSSFAGGRGK